MTAFFRGRWSLPALLLAAGLCAGVPRLAAAAVLPLDKPGQLVLLARWNDPSSYAAPMGDTYYHVGKSGGAQGQSPNLKSAVLQYRAWTSLFGDFIYTAAFAWELSDTYLVGSRPTRTVDVARVRKYPSLAKRLDALRPSFVAATLSVAVRGPAGYQVMYFRVVGADVIVQRSRQVGVLLVPASPIDWRDAVSADGNAQRRFTRNDTSSFKDMMTLLRTADAFEYVPGAHLVDLRIDWPLGEIDNLIALVEQYEREDRKLGEDEALLAPEYKLPKAPAAYARGGELAKAYEEEVKSAQVFTEGKVAGLKVGDRVVMRSDAYSGGSKLDAEGRFFSFSVSGRSEYHLYSANGQRLTIAGTDRFRLVSEGRTKGTWRLVHADDAPGTAYRTRKVYMGGFGVRDNAEFEDFRARDDDGACRTPGAGFVAPAYYLAIARTRATVVDARMAPVSSGDAYVMADRINMKRGDKYCYGD